MFYFVRKQCVFVICITNSCACSFRVTFLLSRRHICPVLCTIHVIWLWRKTRIRRIWCVRENDNSYILAIAPSDQRLIKRFPFFSTPLCTSNQTSMSTNFFASIVFGRFCNVVKNCHINVACCAACGLVMAYICTVYIYYYYWKRLNESAAAAANNFLVYNNFLPHNGYTICRRYAKKNDSIQHMFLASTAKRYGQ